MLGTLFARIFQLPIGLLTLLIAVSEGQAWGWDSVRVLGLLVTTLLMGVLFINIELQSNHPLFDLTLLHNGDYAAGLGITLKLLHRLLCYYILVDYLLTGNFAIKPVTIGIANHSPVSPPANYGTTGRYPRRSLRSSSHDVSRPYSAYFEPIYARKSRHLPIRRLHHYAADFYFRCQRYCLAILSQNRSFVCSPRTCRSCFRNVLYDL
ncbi:hypothetical protein SAMN04490178_12614 [Propionispora vibrioides]|uniref:Uncharacterized protein n=1 Tax=Propionispora vibrioides TaxID=112903 RepID=A0A1H8XP15_9FIRM|nr:hypothetical protein SAMN04490178_12614 [Propionispora vibrioides]